MVDTFSFTIFDQINKINKQSHKNSKFENVCWLTFVFESLKKTWKSKNIQRFKKKIVCKYANFNFANANIENIFPSAHVKTVDEVGPIEGVTADAHAQGLAQSGLRGLLDGLKAFFKMSKYL